MFWYIAISKSDFLLTADDIPFKDGPDLIQARYEWHEASQCYAFERYTACVMHLVRLSEIALRSLARDLVGNKIDGREIEFLDWKPLLDAVEPELEKKIKDLNQQPRSAERQRNVTFYTGAASHLKYFKILRDNAAHARDKYDHGQALSALDRIKEFMTTLGERT
jgi:hypothetical protein